MLPNFHFVTLSRAKNLTCNEILRFAQRVYRNYRSACNQQFVILSEAKDLVRKSSIHTKMHEILRFAQDDKLPFLSVLCYFLLFLHTLSE